MHAYVFKYEYLATEQSVAPSFVAVLPTSSFHENDHAKIDVV